MDFASYLRGFVLTWIVAGLAWAAPPAPDADQPAPESFEPTSAYEDRDLRGWTIRVNRGLLKREPELAAKALELLDHQLFQAQRAVPPPALSKLREIPIWVEEAEPHHPCMAYHPAPEWLRDHGMNPEKARCVEIANARNFLDWSKTQPWMTLHELAHGHHHRHLPDGFDNTEVRDAYDAAVAGKRYDSVLHGNGGEERAYALTDPMEYFAEGSEAFFGTNDFAPFVRAELERHDPRLYELLKKLWGVE